MKALFVITTFFLSTLIVNPDEDKWTSWGGYNGTSVSVLFKSINSKEQMLLRVQSPEKEEFFSIDPTISSVTWSRDNCYIFSEDTYIEVSINDAFSITIVRGEGSDPEKYIVRKADLIKTLPLNSYYGDHIPFYCVYLGAFDSTSVFLLSFSLPNKNEDVDFFFMANADETRLIPCQQPGEYDDALE